jgi:hypothetical protein
MPRGGSRELETPAMNRQLVVYKEFIDKLVALRAGVLTRWVTEKGWPDLQENKEINDFLAKLTPDDKKVLCSILQQSRDGGIHDVLVLLSEETNLRGLRMTKDGVEMAIEPYGTEIYYDWVSRREGDQWPEHQLDSKYK